MKSILVSARGPFPTAPGVDPRLSIGLDVAVARCTGRGCATHFDALGWLMLPRWGGTRECPRCGSPVLPCADGVRD